jgi:hypothetical protein
MKPRRDQGVGELHLSDTLSKEVSNAKSFLISANEAEAPNRALLAVKRQLLPSKVLPMCYLLLSTDTAKQDPVKTERLWSMAAVYRD